MKPGDPDWISLPDWSSKGPMAITQAKAEDILNRRIIPEIGAKGPPPANPSFIMVAGQPGSGKSTTIRQAEMSLQGATQKIIGDDFEAYIPGYHQLAGIDPASATTVAREAGSWQFQAAIAKRARDMRANIVQEFAVPTGSSRNANYYRQQGYRTELHLIATPHYQSWTSVLGRADHALRNGHIGTNVLVPRRSHDECYAGWARAFYDAERYKQFDRARLAARDGSILYDNHLETRADGTKDWAKPPQGLDALLLARHRSITDRDAASVTSAWQSATTNPQLISAVPTWPLNAYAKEVRDFVWSPAGRFEPFSKEPSNSPEAAHKWMNFIRNDLHLTRSSRNQMGYSKEFDDRTHQYALAMIDMGHKAIHVDPAALQHVSAPQQVLSSNPPPAQPASRKRRHEEPPSNGATAAAALLKIREGNGATKRRRLEPRDDRVRGGAIEV